MAEHDIKIGVKVGVEGQESVTSAVKSVGDLSKALDKASGDAGDFSSSLRDMSKYTDAFDRIAESSKPLKSQLREMQKILGEMEFKGLSGTDEFIRMAEQAGGMRDAMDDAAASVRYFADDIKGISTAVGLFEGVAGAVSLAQGALALFGDENKEFEETMRKVQGAMALANGVQQVANTLNKNSTLVMGVANLQKRLAAKLARDHATAVVGETTATKGATLATKALNVVLKANPIGLVITAITSLIGLFAIFRGETEESTESMNEQADAAKRLAAEQDHAQKTIGEAVADSTGKFIRLSVEWKNLRTENERLVWIENNASAFKALGLNVKSVTDANEVFIRQMPRILKVLQLQAEAQANLDLYVEQYKKRQRRLADPTLDSGGKRFAPELTWSKLVQGVATDANGNILNYSQSQNQLKDMAERYGLKAGEDYYVESGTGIGEKMFDRILFLTQSGNEKLIKAEEDAAARRRKTIEEEEDANMKFYLDSHERLSNEAYKLRSDLPNMYDPATSLDPYSARNTSAPKEKQYKQVKVKPLQDKVKKELTELEKLEQQRDELQKRLQNPRLTEYERSDIQGQLDELQKDIEFRRKWTSERMDVLNLPANGFTAVLDGEFDIDHKNFEETLQKSIEKLSTTTTINVDPRDYFTPLQWKTIQHKESALSNAQTGISQVQGWFDSGIIGKEKAQKLIDAFNTQLKIEGLDPIEVKLDAEDAKATLQDIGSMWSSVKGVGDAIEQLTEGLSGNLSAWETIKLVMDSFMSAAQGIDGIIGLIDRFTESTKVSTTTTEAQTQATQEQTMATVTDTMASEVKSQANAGEAVTNATKEGTKAGWPGLLFAIPAALAAVMAGLAMAGAFAEGGIVGGTQKQGDRLLARVNSGEMILNTRQQANLFRLLNSGIDGQRVRMPRAFINPLAVQPQQPQAVRFEIDGRKLVGVLSNETTISSRSGKRTNIRI